MVLHLLERDRAGGKRIAESLIDAIEGIGRCRSCRILTENELCEICASLSRDEKLLCVVENPADVLAIEQAGGYRGKYFVLMGHLSPIDGIGPDEIGMDQLSERVLCDSVKEVILATSSTVEGEATAHYVSEQLRSMGVEISRIAHGIPFGGELEFVDGGTLAHAMEGRKKI
jgi:recombination protein RecR